MTEKLITVTNRYAKITKKNEKYVQVVSGKDNYFCFTQEVFHLIPEKGEINALIEEQGKFTVIKSVLPDDGRVHPASGKADQILEIVKRMEKRLEILEGKVDNLELVEAPISEVLKPPDEIKAEDLPF